jgi:hypothetical protein
MAIVNQVQKKVILSKKDVIKFQILTHCYINRITVSDSDLECLTLLSLIGPIELTHFCFEASDEHVIFKSEQTVRNCVNKCEKNKLVSKDSTNKLRLTELWSKILGLQIDKQEVGKPGEFSQEQLDEFSNLRQGIKVFNEN